MNMTLSDAKYCLSPNHKCQECKFNDQEEFDCRQEAFSIGETAINYILVGQKLSEEINAKER